eukprot:gnl/MRDRNA2_/MRDRNA2_110127_c0_seq1.p1 gnl/MRDRNA2_/MRDRNA2_110127_c0~~gnl/MRDRNA2_/MRDRNA2_110127_c0_seq1.p1  ORF type:complete len:779 (+),score=154.02 gnl/MRDRNA2_/MRDRNA2_110127_c0_seq1:37-2337(+)
MSIRFEVDCRTQIGECVGVCGSFASLGLWDVKRCFVLSPNNYPVWSGEINIEATGTTAGEYKYVIISFGPGGQPELKSWEEIHPNRKVEYRGNGQLVLSHFFGNPEQGSERYVSMPKDSPKASPGGYPNDKSDRPEGDDKSGGAVLEDVNVEPGTRVFRCVQSESGAEFAAKYEVQPRAVLGSGMSGSVCVAKVRSTGLEVALKTLSVAGITDQQRKMILNEIQNQLSMDHPNICRLLEVYEGPSEIRLIIEKMQGPDMFDHLSSKGTYSEGDACVCVRQMCSAVSYCHSKGVCHKDLKLENFCFESKDANARVKMIDFGLSEAFTSLPMTHACGTLLYVAPEVLKGRYTEKCDMWSMGVITYVMLSGTPPFQGRSDRDTARQIMKGIDESCFEGPKWTGISKDARSFMLALLCTTASLRLSAEAALAHPWLERGGDSISAQPVPLDAAVLQGMRALARGNTLKRAVLTAVAPIATVEEVTRWADQFEALDEQGCGMISVKDLAQRLMELSASKEEAEELSMTLGNLDDNPEQISYSAFLAACLSAHMTLGDEQVRELFDRLDKNNDGFVSIEECQAGLGDLLDMDELHSELHGQLSYDEFCRLLLGPRLGPSTCKGLRQLLGAYSSIRQQWRIDTIRAKINPDDAMEAARAENAAWRTWARDGGEPPSTPKAGHHNHDNKENSVCAKPETILEALGENKTAAWAVATAEAKQGDVEAARRENMAWRLWHREQIKDDKKMSSHSSMLVPLVMPQLGWQKIWSKFRK